MVGKLLGMGAILLGVACRPTTATTALPPDLRRDAIARVLAAWSQAGLPAVRLFDVQIEIADDCDSFQAHCQPAPPAIGCVPEATRHTRECAPTDELVVISPYEQERLIYAIHGLIHIASDRTDLNIGPGDRRGADTLHRDHRLWGPNGVEARARGDEAAP